MIKKNRDVKKRHLKDAPFVNYSSRKGFLLCWGKNNVNVLQEKRITIYRGGYDSAIFITYR